MPATLVAGWLVAGLPLLMAGALRPVWTILLAAVVSIPAVVLVTRLDVAQPRATVPLLLTVAIAGGFAGLAWTTSSEHVVVRRDPAVYAQTADWLAHHGRLPIPAHVDAFGATSGLSYASPGFYQRGDPPTVVPQFMSGTSLALTPAGWAGGLRGITRADAVIAALALLAVAGLAARLVGPWAAPLAALVVGLAYPDLQAARSAFSEPAAQLLLFGGLSLLVDAGRAVSSRVATSAHAVAGLLIGLVVLVRIDALVELTPLVPVLAVLAITGRRRDALATGTGLAVGVGLGLLDGFVLSRPYLDTIAHQVRLTAVAIAVAVVATVVVTAGRHRLAAIPGRWRRRGPDVAAVVVVVAAAAAYFIRPLVMHPHYPPGNPAGADVVALQSQLGLPADGPRTYVEHSMQWLGWWIGPTGLAFGVIGAALLLARVLRRPSDPALPFVLVLLGTAVVVFAQPAITPDHPGRTAASSRWCCPGLSSQRPGWWGGRVDGSARSALSRSSCPSWSGPGRCSGMAPSVARSRRWMSCVRPCRRGRPCSSPERGSGPSGHKSSAATAPCRSRWHR